MRIMRTHEFLALEVCLVLLKQFGRFCSSRYSLENFSAFHIIYNQNTCKIFLCEIFGKFKNTCEVEFQELGSVGNRAMFSCYLPSLLYFVVTSEKK